MWLVALNVARPPLRGTVAGAIAAVVVLAASSAASATTITVEGPLGTTVSTPPLELGAPGAPSPVNGTSVSVAGITVSAEGTAASEPSSPSSPSTPASPAAPAQQAPAQGAASQPAQSSPSSGGSTQRGGAAEEGGSQRTGGETRAETRSGTEATPSGSQSSGPTDRSAASGTDGAAESRNGSSSDEPAREQPRRPSVAERIVDRVPTAYRLALLVATALAGGFALATMRERRRARRAEAEALVDPLTGLANRRAFDRRLAEEWQRSERYGHPLGLVMLDLDGFKQVNDTRGHKEGDRILREAASLIADRLRAVDLAARFGGDEFAALCPETAREGLEALTHSLERCLESLPVGASIGYAEREREDENPLDLLTRADAAMYRQKQGGEVPQPVAVG